MIRRPGYAYQVADREVNFAPFTVGVIERFSQIEQDKLEATMLIDLLLLSARRNHKDITRDFLAENLDLEEVMEIFGEVLKVSGVERAGKALARALGA